MGLMVLTLAPQSSFLRQSSNIRGQRPKQQGSDKDTAVVFSSSSITERSVFSKVVSNRRSRQWQHDLHELAALKATSPEDMNDPVALLVVLEMETPPQKQRQQWKLRILTSECSLTNDAAAALPVYTVQQLRSRILREVAPEADHRRTEAELELIVFTSTRQQHTTSNPKDLGVNLSLSDGGVNVLSEYGGRIGIRARWVVTPPNSTSTSPPPLHPDTTNNEPILAICGRYFDFNGTFRVNPTTTLNILQVPNQPNAGTSFNVWDGSILLASYLISSPSSLQQHVQHRHVLELGAGCGLAGLTAAAAGARQVTLTDRPGAPVRHLQANVDHNRVSCCPTTVRPCDWLAPPPEWLEEETFDTVLVADCVWKDDLVEPLLGILDMVTAPSITTPAPPATANSTHQLRRDEDSWETEHTISSKSLQPLDTTTSVYQSPAPTLEFSPTLLSSDAMRRKMNRDERSSSTIDESQHEFVRGKLERSDSFGNMDFPFFSDDDDDDDESRNDDDFDDVSSLHYHDDEPAEAGPATQVIIAYQRRGQSTHEAFWKGLHRLFRSIEHVHVPGQPEVFSLLVCSR